MKTVGRIDASYMMLQVKENTSQITYGYTIIFSITFKLNSILDI